MSTEKGSLTCAVSTSILDVASNVWFAVMEAGKIANFKLCAISISFCHIAQIELIALQFIFFVSLAVAQFVQECYFINIFKIIVHNWE